MTSPRHMHLGFLLQFGVHHAGWRDATSRPDRVADIAYYADIARKVEAGKLDFLFWADTLSLFTGDGQMKAVSTRNEPMRFMEPFTMMSALAMVTERLGLILTASTTYNEPFHIARKFASLDHISHGRSGWNVVTSAYAAEAANFGRDALVEHATRYERAGEFVSVVKDLWDSLDDGAILADKQAGLFLDAAHVHQIDHKGEHLTVRGPLNVPRPPQGHPVIVQAGGSGAGMDLAAATAEVVFTAGQTLADAKRFYADLKGRVAAAGRDPESLKILPGLMPFIGKTEAEAQEIRDRVNGLVHIDVGMHVLSQSLGGVDLSAYPLDGPLPEMLPPSNSSQSRRELIEKMARTEKLTIRQLALRMASAAGHGTVCGSAAQIADRMEEWVKEGAADGFVVLPPMLPATCDSFIDLVVPELQRRGLFRTEYEGRTLRDHLGLKVPPSRFSA